MSRITTLNLGQRSSVFCSVLTRLVLLSHLPSLEPTLERLAVRELLQSDLLSCAFPVLHMVSPRLSINLDYFTQFLIFLVSLKESLIHSFAWVCSLLPPLNSQLTPRSTKVSCKVPLDLECSWDLQLLLLCILFSSTPAHSFAFQLLLVFVEF